MIYMDAWTLELSTTMLKLLWTMEAASTLVMNLGIVILQDVMILEQEMVNIVQ